MQVLSVYEARKRTTTVGNDAEIGAAVGLYMLEREVRMAGAGLTLPAGFACAAGVNLFYERATVSDGAPLAPLPSSTAARDRTGSRGLRSDANSASRRRPSSRTWRDPADGDGQQQPRPGRRATCSLVGGADGARSAR